MLMENNLGMLTDKHGDLSQGGVKIRQDKALRAGIGRTILCNWYLWAAGEIENRPIISNYISNYIHNRPIVSHNNLPFKGH